MRLLSLLAFILLGLVCASSLRAAPDTAPHQIKRVKAGAIVLSYLDFGGHGPAMVMLPGLNDTGHIYDDLAPKFTDLYHVYALTRRGCGDSDKPASGYDMKSLVSDLAAFLDARHIQKATLVGHSLAGDELTGFAGTFPERVDKLVYFDAAYDRSGGPFGAFAAMTLAQATTAAATPPFALISLDFYRNYWKQFAAGAWSPASENNMRDKIIVGKGGVLTEKCPARVTGALLIGSAQAHPDETKVKAPALCFFALFKAPTAAQAQAMGASADAMKPTLDWQQAQIEKAKTEMHAQVVEMEPGTSHYLFIQHPTEVEKTMRAFLIAH